MRPRFSIRVLFFVIAFAAFGCYWGFVRPTVIAERFVDAVNTGDYQAARSLFIDPASELLTGLREGSPHQITAELLPRGWQDVWTFRRSIVFRVMFRSESLASRLKLMHQSDMLATATGIWASPLHPVTIFESGPDLIPSSPR